MAIAGRPNVGKSSLFNALLRDSRAIVSPIPGTTRDRIEELITLDGVPVRITDTAGLRDTHDAVEQIGVKIARDAVQNADFVLLVIDASAAGQEDQDLVRFLQPGPLKAPGCSASASLILLPTSFFSPEFKKSQSRPRSCAKISVRPLLKTKKSTGNLS
jgi:GTPase SAR1 family protein